MAEPTSIVRSFLCAVMRDKDFDVVRSLLADGVVYENVGYSTMRGADRIVSTFRRLNTSKLRFDVTIHQIAQDGCTVLTERTDSMIIGAFEAKFWVCGVFEVHDGQITLWRDYFDFYDLFMGVARGLAALAIPALRRK